MLSAAPAAVPVAADPAPDAAIVGRPTPVARNFRSLFGFGAFMPQLQRIPEGVDVALPAVPRAVASAIPSRLGESMGEILSQTITGKALSPLKAFEAAAYGVAVEAVGSKDKKEGQGMSASDDNRFMFWAPLLACAFVGGLKLLEGRPDEIVEACQVGIALPFLMNNAVRRSPGLLQQWFARRLNLDFGYRRKWLLSWQQTTFCFRWRASASTTALFRRIRRGWRGRS